MPAPRWRVVAVVVVIALAGYFVVWWQLSRPTPISHRLPVGHLVQSSPATSVAAATTAPSTSARARPQAFVPPKPPPLKPATLDLDEKEIASLINDMGGADFAVREAAAQKLKKLGPERVPALGRFRDNDDPEIATRVNAVIRSFDWMNHGAVVVEMVAGSQGARLGILPGDVIVKINDTPVMGRATVAKVTPDQPRTLYVWRAGRIYSVKVAGGSVGVYLGDWDLAKGGNDQARGLAQFAREQTGGGSPDTAEAYRRLRAARDAGMTDRWSCGLLACLAAQQLDHKVAMASYRLFRGSDGTCDLTHRAVEMPFHGLPFNSPHSAFLLERFRAEPWSPLLYHELEDWFCRAGRNYPMLKEVIGQPWQAAQSINVDLRRFDAEARLKVDIAEHRWADALRDYDNSPDFLWQSDWRHGCAISAAIHAGRVDKAVDVAARLLEHLRTETNLSPISGDVWYAINAAGAAGDVKGIERLSGLIHALDANTQAHLVDDRSLEMSQNVGAAEYTLRLLAEFARIPNRQNARTVYFGLLAASPTTTAEKFRQAWDQRVTGKNESFLVDLAGVDGFLRFGDYDRARTAWDGYLKARPYKEPPPKGVVQTIEFATQNAKRLQTDWSDLRGMLQVRDGGEKDTHWVLRWDGAVLFVDAAGKVRQYPGLPPPAMPLRATETYLIVGERSVWCRFPYPQLESPVVFNMHIPNPPYVLDTRAGRWINAYTTDVDVDWGMGGRREALAVAVMRYVNKTYPLPAGEAPRRYMLKNDGDFWLEGNLRVRCSPSTGEITDLSAEVGKAAGLSRPAEIYDIGGDRSGLILVLSDVGLFQMDRDEVRRVELPGLKEQNVHLCYMDFQAYYGFQHAGRLIGVAPQDGGQVFELMPDRTVRATTGFCGLGPQDWFASEFTLARWGSSLALADLIQGIYLKRVAGEQK